MMAPLLAHEQRLYAAGSILKHVTQALKRRCEVWAICLGLSTCYGAACGAGFGVLLSLLTESSLMAAASGGIAGCFCGGLAGVIGGCVTGAIGSFARGPVGWCIAGVLGGLTPSTMLWAGLQVEGEMSHAAGLLVILLPVVVAGSLGLAVGRAARADTVSLPGMEALVKAIHEANPGRPTGIPSHTSAEVIPARAPGGRGDELTPALHQESAPAAQEAL